MLPFSLAIIMHLHDEVAKFSHEIVMSSDAIICPLPSIKPSL